ncbi:hypothetical protein SELMODRAFT_431592 [Selaginella moellendorffii]|uniref:Protein kinase domain-containing protein n=1 Tax=Selaginella moellendorffii TaxID=88036 RepID=D8TD54_SELML|nr:hypothetical protein SELMODRAFT_431592 [Selaginella moellendorffii]
MIERVMRTIRRAVDILGFCMHEVTISTIDKPKLLSRRTKYPNGWSCEDTEGLQSALERLRHHKEAWIKPNLHSNGLRKQGHLKIPFDGKDDWEIDSDHSGYRTRSLLDHLYRGTYCGKFSAYGIIYCFNATRFVHSYSLTEYLSGGSLYDYLHKHRSALKLPLVLRLGIDVSKGMDYRHQNNILRRDFKAANLRMRTRLLDFVVVRIMTAETETYRWMTPEVIEHKLYDQKADIFSPGIVLCCLMIILRPAVAVVQKYWKDAGKQILMSDQNFVTANDRLQGKDVARGGPGRFELVSSAVKAALDGVNEELQMSEMLGGAIPDASELIRDCLSGSLSNATSSRITDIHTWMSSALTYHTTCFDGLSQRYQLSKFLTKPPEKAVTNVVVAQDGSGRYTTISAAIAAAPSRSASTYVIYIKAGTYKEKVSVPKSKTKQGRLLLLEINGRGFLCRDLTIQNTAGAAKQQAVALRVSEVKVAFYKCTFEGYQDTLYTHVMRQFYRECTVYGTVDFIFGDAAAVFQSCTILARVPMDKQKNTLTAQGRTDPNQNTGLAFQDCTLDGTDDLKKSGTQTYLGRPWKQYSRTVFLRCYEISVIDPAGWLAWSGNFALKTLFYAEYQCKGPGSGTGSTVSWSRQLNSYAEASKYTPVGRTAEYLHSRICCGTPSAVYLWKLQKSGTVLLDRMHTDKVGAVSARTAKLTMTAQTIRCHRRYPLPSMGLALCAKLIFGVPWS